MTALTSEAITLRIVATLMVPAALGPVLLTPDCLIFTCILLLAGVLSLLIKPPQLIPSGPTASNNFA